MKALRFLTPRTLFARSLLILVLPLVLVQLASTYFFYDSHWEKVRKHMAASLANEVAYVVRRAEHASTRQGSLAMAEKFFELTVSWEGPDQFHHEQDERRKYPMLRAALANRLHYPFIIYTDTAQDRELHIDIEMPTGVLKLAASDKRIASATTYIFILWVNGVAVLFLVIAILFLKNQIRPIQALARAAKRFGRGQDDPDFKPRGALEVRRAGQAFLIMKERISRQMQERMEMLAAISHDLRTPITRMKLQLEMAEDRQLRDDLMGDLGEMHQMIDEYLDFARGEGGEQASDVEMEGFLRGLVEDFQRQGNAIEVRAREVAPTIRMKPNAMRRALQNILTNALRYGEMVQLKWKIRESSLLILVDDNGPGIPESEYEDVFRAFHKRDASRKSGDGGVGLGLAIAKDIVLGHGGTIRLEPSKLGGLRVIIELPL